MVVCQHVHRLVSDFGLQTYPTVSHPPPTQPCVGGKNLLGKIAGARLRKHCNAPVALSGGQWLHLTSSCCLNLQRLHCYMFGPHRRKWWEPTNANHKPKPTERRVGSAQATRARPVKKRPSAQRMPWKATRWQPDHHHHPTLFPSESVGDPTLTAR